MKHSASCTLIIPASVDKVWDALTLPAIVKTYFFGTDLETTWVPGAPIFFRGEWEGKTYEDRGTVLSFEPKSTLSYDYWSAASGKEDIVAARTIVRFALERVTDGVRITVEQSNFATQAEADHSAGTWQGVLEAMKRVLS